MKVQIATRADIQGWLELASQVEFLFGPMVDQPDFQSALYKNIDRESAYCVREQDRSAGAPLMGGLFLSSRPSEYHIRWLAVAEQWRRRGIGTVLLEYVFDLIKSPAELFVTTFGEDNLEGQPARQFYKEMGFEFLAEAPPGPEGDPERFFKNPFCQTPFIPFESIAYSLNPTSNSIYFKIGYMLARDALAFDFYHPISRINTWRLQDPDNTGMITHLDSRTEVWQNYTSYDLPIHVKRMRYFSIC